MIEASKAMCALCWDTIRTELSSGSVSVPKRDLPELECALFVSLKHTDNQELRGCVGTFESDLCDRQLRKYASLCAFSDPRFSKVTHIELESLSLSVTILSNFTKIKDCFDWVIGEHGISIEFFDPHRKKNLSAVFLPVVMVEQGWDHRETVLQLLRKAGYTGSIQKIDLKKVLATRFHGCTKKMSYGSYLRSCEKEVISDLAG